MNNLPKHHDAGPYRRGAQCSCIGFIGLRPALVPIVCGAEFQRRFHFVVHSALVLIIKSAMYTHS